MADDQSADKASAKSPTTQPASVHFSANRAFIALQLKILFVREQNSIPLFQCPIGHSSRCNTTLLVTLTGCGLSSRVSVPYRAFIALQQRRLQFGSLGVFVCYCRFSALSGIHRVATWFSVRDQRPCDECFSALSGIHRVATLFTPLPTGRTAGFSALSGIHRVATTSLSTRLWVDRSRFQCPIGHSSRCNRLPLW